VSGESPRVPLWITSGGLWITERTVTRKCYKGCNAYDGVLTGFLLLDPFEEVPVSELGFDFVVLSPLGAGAALSVDELAPSLPLSLPAPLALVLAEEVVLESVR
jgi:hypothetical protein